MNTIVNLTFTCVFAKKISQLFPNNNDIHSHNKVTEHNTLTYSKGSYYLSVLVLNKLVNYIRDTFFYLFKMKFQNFLFKK